MVISIVRVLDSSVLLFVVESIAFDTYNFIFEFRSKRLVLMFRDCIIHVLLVDESRDRDVCAKPTK